MSCRVTPSSAAAPSAATKTAAQGVPAMRRWKQTVRRSSEIRTRSSLLAPRLACSRHSRTPLPLAPRYVFASHEPSRGKPSAESRVSGNSRPASRSAVGQLPRRADALEHVARVAPERRDPGHLIDELGMVFECAGVHPRRRLDRPQPIDEALRIRRDARRRGDRAEIGVGEQIGRERLKAGPHRRRGRRPGAGADDGEWLVSRGY